MSGALVWETIELKDHSSIERTIFNKTQNRKNKDSSEAVNGKPVHRVTGENAIKKRRLESINESDLSMAERLGNNCSFTIMLFANFSVDISYVT